MTIRDIFWASEISLASYAELDKGDTRIQTIQLEIGGGGLSVKQAEEFSNRYTSVEAQYNDDVDGNGNGTSLSATVFKDSAGQYTLAMRGTLELSGTPNDLSPTDTNIALRGAGYNQIVAMYNWWKRETSLAGDMVQQYAVRSYHDGQEGVPDGAVYLYSDQLFDNTKLAIDRSYYLVESSAIEATGNLNHLAGEQLNVTGHSLGGHLAMAFGTLFAQNTAEVTVFNAPGFIDSSANQDFFAALGGGVPGGVATTNVIADQAQVGKAPWNAIAGLHSRPGMVVDIPIEDQWLSDEPDTTGALNHSQQTLTDALAVYAKLTEYDPALGTTDFKAILASAVAGTAGGLERIVDALQGVFQGETAPLAVGNANRDQLYQALYDLPEGTGGNPIIALDGLPSAEIAARAQTDIAHRYALVKLNPFAITGNDALYTSLPDAGELALYDPTAGTGSITDTWLVDRAELLSRMLESNRLDAGFITGTGEAFQAAAGTGTVVLTTGDVGSLGVNIDQALQYRFGSEDGEAISGGERDDRLYGMGGDDTLIGGGGADRLEGGEGYDSYNSGDGDVILDTDGSGKILFEGHLLSGGVDDDADGIYEADGGKIQYSRNGTTLSVLNVPSNATLKIEDFDNNELGIDLAQDQPDDGNGQFSQHVGTASGERIDGDQGNNIISGIGGQDILTGFLGSDRIFSEVEIGAQDAIEAAQTMPGTETKGDFLDGRKGDDLLVGSPDRDVLAGGLGDDTLIGGGGKDFIDGDREGWLVRSDWEFSVSTVGSSIVPAADNFSLIHAGSTPGEGHDRIYGGMGEDFILGQTGDDVIDAGADDDVVNAGEGDDVVYGRAGSDLLFADGDYTPAGHGNDYINGGEGPDGIYGQGGRDILVGGEGDDYIRGDNRGFGSDIETIPEEYHGGDTLLGGLGIDTLYGDGGDDFIDGGAGSDVLYGDDPFAPDAYAGNDVLSGGDGADLIVGQNGDDILYGGNGDDGGPDTARLVGGAGNDILYGESGDDYLFGDADDVDAGKHGNDRLFGGADDDVLIGHGGDDYLDGGTGADELFGDEGADVLIGGAGDDRLEGGSGADILDGGEGNDILLVDAEDTIHWRAEPGTDFVAGGGALINMIGVDSSNITVTQAVDPSLGDLLVINTGQSYLALVDGVLSANSSYSFSGEVMGQAEFMRLASALDIDGSQGSDEIYGSDQADVIRGYDDTAPDQDGGDVLFGQGGDDQLEGGAGNDRLDGGTGADTLVGGAGDDVFVVDDAADTVVESAASGVDTVEAGIDYVLGADVENVVLTGEAQTRATGNALANVLTGNDADNTLEGLAGDDSISGKSGEDILKGGYGEDGLSGGEGDDRLVGGFGNDILYGGAGADTYVFNPDDGQDVIVDADVGNTVEFGASVNPADVSVSQYRGDDGSYYLKLTYTLNGDSVAIQNGLAGKISAYRFLMDGSDVGHQDLVGNANIPIETNGTDSDDWIIGGAMTDIVDGREGDDEIDGAAGADRLSGGRGADIIHGGSGDDAIDGGAGNDELIGGDGVDNYRLGWGMGKDVLRETAAGSSTLRLDPGLSFDDVAVSAGSSDLTVRLKGTDDGVVIENYVTDTHDWSLEDASGASVTLATLLHVNDTETIDSLIEEYVGAQKSKFFSDLSDRGYGLQPDGSYAVTTVSNSPTLIKTTNSTARFDEIITASNDMAIARDSYVYSWINLLLDRSSSQHGVLTTSPGSSRIGQFTGWQYSSDGSLSLQTIDPGNSQFIEVRPDSGSPGVGNNNQSVGLWVGDTAGSGGSASTGGLGIATIPVTYEQWQTAHELTLERTIGGNADNSITVSNVSVARGGEGDDTLTVVRAKREFTQIFAASEWEPYPKPARFVYESISPFLNPGAFLSGDGGNDTLTGSDNNDTLIGGDGIDVLDGGGGADSYHVLAGHQGIDFIIDTGSVNGLLEAPEINRYANWYYRNQGVVDYDAFLDTFYATGTMPQGMGLPPNISRHDYTALQPLHDDEVIAKDVVSFGAGIEISDISVDYGYLIPGDLGLSPHSGWGEPDKVHTTLDISVNGGGTTRVVIPHSLDVLENMSSSPFDSPDEEESEAGDEGQGTSAPMGDLEYLQRVYRGLGLGVEEFRFSDGTVLSMTDMLVLAGPAPSFDPHTDSPFLGDNNANVITGNDGDNTLMGFGGNDTLDGDAGDDVLDGGRGADSLYGGDGNDVLRAGDSGPGHWEYLFGEGGHDVLTASGDGNVVMWGGEGVDELTGTTGSGRSYLFGGGGDDSLRAGGDGFVFIAGGAGNDTLVGGGGNDWLNGMQGADVMAGGLGDDTYLVDAAGDTVMEASDEGHDRVFSSVDWDLSADVEDLVLMGGVDLVGTGNALDNELTGNGGANTLWGRDGDDLLQGANGNDFLYGEAGDDLLDGGAGADLLYGGSGDDILRAGGSDASQWESLHGNAGHDVMTAAGDGNVVMWGGEGVDELTGTTGSGRSYLFGGGGDDSLRAGGDGFVFIAGGAGNDTLVGGGGNDWLNGMQGADAMAGGLGDDTYLVDAAADSVTEAAGEGHDSVLSSVGWSLSPHVEDLSLMGTKDLPGTGNALDNTLIGNGWANTLRGGDGDDTLNGESGDDILEGGSGSDRYLFNRNSGADRINDYDPQDADPSTYGVTTDSLEFGNDIAHDQLWFARDNQDLLVSVIGTLDQVRVQGWYQGEAYQLDQFLAGDDQMLLNDQVDQLVQAMAGFAPPAAGELNLSPALQNQLQPALAAVWQSA